MRELEASVEERTQRCEASDAHVEALKGCIMWGGGLRARAISHCVPIPPVLSLPCNWLTQAWNVSSKSEHNREDLLAARQRLVSVRRRIGGVEQQEEQQEEQEQEQEV